MKELYLLRHGDTGLNGRYIGSTDVPLAEKGKKQVQATGQLLKECGISRILSSPMLRCRQSLALLDLAVPHEFFEILREIDFGEWEGKNFQEVQQSDKKLVEAWSTKPKTFTFPGGESLFTFRKRVVEVQNLLHNFQEDKVLLLAHGGIIRYLLCLLLGLSPEKYLLFDVRPGCFSSVQLYSEGAVLTGFNIKG